MKTLLLLAPFVLVLGACSLLVDFGDPKTPTERDCDDGFDNDGDGFTDCLDQDCETDEACGGPNANNLNNVYNNVNNVNNMNNIVGPEICDDGEDNDGDGLYDCDDVDDCAEHPFCAPPEECFDEEDNDFDGLTDCFDPDCWFWEECDLPGEYDCGDAVDNEDPDGAWPPAGDGRIDCDDRECETSPLCGTQPFIRCNSTIEHFNNFETIYYYQDIYQNAMSSDCPPDHYCTVRPELSRVPYCQPLPNTVVPAYDSCNPSSPCGTGLVCAWSDTLSQGQSSNVCLPFCAPGRLNTCLGNAGICYRRMEDAFDGYLGLFVETWTCDQPACDPLAPTGGTASCPETTSTCIPATDLMGGAFCHPTVGTFTPGTPCTTDNQCVRGHVCRQGPLDGGVNRCHPLCRSDGQCLQTSACLKTDNRQYFGFCK